MEAKRLEVLPAAQLEALDAASWYFERNPAVAAALETELRVAFSRIALMPTATSASFAPARRFLLKRFPYEVIFRIYPEVILIVAIAHVKRRPGYWRRR